MSTPESESGSKVPRVAAYARYSRVKDHEAVTIEAQLDGIKEFLDRKGWALARNYTDEEVPGATPPEERPGLQELLDDMAAKKFEGVMTLDDSRLARSNVVFWDIIKRFRAAGVVYRMLIVPEVGSDKDEFEVLAGTLQGGSSFLSKKTSTLTKSGIRKLKTQGFATNHPPNGYRLVPSEPNNPKSHRLIKADALGERAIQILAERPKVKGRELAQELDITLDQAFKLRRAVEKYGNGGRYFPDLLDSEVPPQ